MYIWVKTNPLMHIISITIVRSYTEKYHSLLPSVMLRVHSMSNNANGNKWVIFFSRIAWYYGDNDYHMTCSTDTDFHVTCSKNIWLFINCRQLQAFPINSHTFTWVRRMIITHTQHIHTVHHDGCAINNGNCQHFCFTVPDRNGGTRPQCGCPTGIKLCADNRTCPEGKCQSHDHHMTAIWQLPRV